MCIRDRHEGEAVLTKAEARAYRQDNSSPSGGGITINQHFYDRQNDPQAQQRQAQREFRRLRYAP